MQKTQVAQKKNSLRPIDPFYNIKVKKIGIKGLGGEEVNFERGKNFTQDPYIQTCLAIFLTFKYM